MLNPNCITQTEHYLPPLVKQNGGVDCCAYCDKELRKGGQPPPDTGISRFALTFFPILHILNAIHSDEGKEYPRGRCREGPDGARPSGGAGKVVPELRA